MSLDASATQSTPLSENDKNINLLEKPAWAINGFVWVFCSLLLWIITIGSIIVISTSESANFLNIVLILALLLNFILTSGLTIVSPGNTKVLQFFGRYVGTVRRPGFWMVLPFTTRSTVSVKVGNFETHEIKVNDADGNPINIAAIVVWQVSDTAKSMFGVENYKEFVAVQAESALRHVAMTHPYDGDDGQTITLRGDTEIVCDELAKEVSARIKIAGLEVLEMRISALSYAPEIAQAMLQRQQAAAIIAAREKIVAGAVGMVETALTALEQGGLVELDDERRAAMVSNLLVVLTSERGASPVVNAGSLY